MDQEIIERLRRNEEVAEKFFEVEVDILSSLGFRELFERLIGGVKEKFGVPFVWISLLEEFDIADLIWDLNSSDLLRQRLNTIDGQSFMDLTQNTAAPLLVNDHLSPFYRIFPPNEAYLIRSLAVVPITLNGKPIGSLNLGDHSSLRYAPGMDTSLLERLGIKVSICLSNIIDREKNKPAASRDPVTGLYNGRVMELVLNREFKRAIRYRQPLSLISIVLDQLEAINTRYGRDIGQALMRYVGRHVDRITRETDLVAKTAKDRLTIILPATLGEEAVKMMKRIEAFLRGNPMSLAGKSVKISLSFGVGSNHDAGVDDAASLLAKAEQMSQTRRQERKKRRRVVPFDRRS